MLNLDKVQAGLRRLKLECDSCKRCVPPTGDYLEMFGCVNYTRKVWARGSHKVDVCIIGEAPGEDEEAKLKPFVGDSGVYLAESLARIGKTSRDVYIANILKCRPPGNRNPTKYEIEACLPWLQEQMNLIRPKVLITLGNFATQTLTGVSVGITKIHGQLIEADLWWVREGRTNCYLPQIYVIPIYHPAYVLRRGKNPETDAEFVDDLRKAFQIAEAA